MISRYRSLANFMTNIIAGIIAYHLFSKKLPLKHVLIKNYPHCFINRSALLNKFYNRGTKKEKYRDNKKEVKGKKIIWKAHECLVLRIIKGRKFASFVPRTGIEPALPCGNQILSLARLPIPPSGQDGYWDCKSKIIFSICHIFF